MLKNLNSRKRILEQLLEDLIPVQAAACTQLCSKGLAVMITHLVSLAADVQWGHFHLAV